MVEYKSRLEQFDVIVYGIGGTLKQSLDYIRYRFNIVGCSDRNPEKAEDNMVKGIPYYCPDDIKNAEFDYIIIASDFDDSIYQDLVENKGIDAAKVLKREHWYRMVFHYSFGSANPDKTFYVMSKPIRVKNGLMSNVLCFLEQMSYVENNGFIPVVDMQNYGSQYLEDDKIGIENAWSYYYETMSEYSLEDVYSSKNVIMGYDDNCYMTDYHNQYDIDTYSRLWNSYIKLRPDIENHISSEYNKILGGKHNVLGVLYRGTDMVSLKLKNHAIQPTVEEMTELIRKYIEEWKCDWIFLCTEDENALNHFKKEFGDKLLYTSQERFSNTGNKWLAQINTTRDNDKFLRGLEYLTTIELLTRCDYMLAGICTGSVCAGIANGGRYKNIHMVDKGMY